MILSGGQTVDGAGAFSAGTRITGAQAGAVEASRRWFTASRRGVTGMQFQKVCAGTPAAEGAPAARHSGASWIGEAPVR